MWVKKITSLIIAFFLTLFSALGHSLAAVQGTLSAPNGTSSGQKTIIVIYITSKVKITGFEDFEVSDWKIGDGDINHSNDLCVYANTQNGYNVTATSSNGSFNMSSSDNGHDLPYSLAWNDGSTDTPLAYNTITTNNFANGYRYDPDCFGSSNSTLKLTILATDLQQTPGVDNAYIDVVTITITPS